MVITYRGIDPNKQTAWMDNIEKENKLRLTWFQKNKDKLETYTDERTGKHVAQEVLDNKKQDTIDRYKNVEKHPIKIMEYAPPKVEFTASQGNMRPVDEKVRMLIYTGEGKDARKNYLNERYKLLPEERYYYPEVTSEIYGWCMADYNKNLERTTFGRKQVIKESFFRRRGLSVDPFWYKEPAKLSPNICM